MKIGDRVKYTGSYYGYKGCEYGVVKYVNGFGFVHVIFDINPTRYKTCLINELEVVE